MILVVCCKIFRAKLVSPPQMILGSYAHIPNHSKSNIDRSKVQKNLPIIVRFANRDKRNEIYSERHLLKSDSKLNTSRIDIREDLTSFRKFLYKEAKKVKNQLNYNFLWKSQRQIFLRKSPTSRVSHQDFLAFSIG